MNSLVRRERLVVFILILNTFPYAQLQIDLKNIFPLLQDKPHHMLRSIISFLFLFAALTALCQTKTYTGVYQFDEKSGTATYSYIPKNGEDVLHGAFSFKSKLGLSGTFTASGTFENNIKSGNWINTSSWSVYNDQEVAKSDLIFSRVSQFRPFIEISKNQTLPYMKGKLNGKEILLFTKKESWGESGGGQKVIVYKKEKNWKDGFIQSFSFEIVENNVRKEFLNGNYALVDGVIVYDGEWVGMVNGISIRVVFDKGAMKYVLTKNQSSGEVLKQESYLTDEELVNKFNDINNISIEFNNDKAKLLITKMDNGNYEFEVISSNFSAVYPDYSVKPLVSFINYVEKSNPYDNQNEDKDWMANVSTLSKKYLSNNRQKADFWSVNADGENANRIFGLIDETLIEYIGSGPDFFLQNKNNVLLKTWENGIPSYFNQSMYIKHLLYKGKADIAFKIFYHAEGRGIFTYGDNKKWSINTVGTMPYYFISLCLAGYLDDADWILQNNINKVQILENGSKIKWMESVSKDIQNYLPFIQKAYPQERIDYLLNIDSHSRDLKKNATNAYFDSLSLIKIGQLSWTSNPISMEQIDISATAIRDGNDKYGNKYEKTVAILNYLNSEEMKQFERKGWRLPTISELKDLMARNLSDYGMNIFEIDPMNNDQLVYINNYKEFRFITKDDMGNLVVYNATKNMVMIPSENDKNKVSGLCLLIKVD